MSCFRGQMEEYTAIAIDRFDGKNLQCTSFFLSHCHRDHMVGLNQPAFHDCLSSRQNVFLYCSEISRILLLAEDEFLHLEKFIKTLEVGSTHHVCVPKTTQLKRDTMVTVTPISAGHCPGSVMFLFEGKEGTALYTGDFRWEVSKVAKISAFREGDHVKSIKSLYVDTTFCIPEAYHIPSRNECLDATTDLISNWLERNELRMVSISCPAKYGHEHLLAELGRRLNTKIHVPKWKIDIYHQIPELSGIFSHDPRECRIHACSWKLNMSRASTLPCGHSAPGKEFFQVLRVRPSTMWFTSGKTRASTKDLVVAPTSHRGLHRVCYSMHSSYSEIRDVVSFLQPGQVFPNVLPAPDSDMEVVQTRLNGFLKMPHKARLSSPTGGDDTFKPLGRLRTKPRQAGRKKLSTGYSSSEELVFSSQEQSPARVKAEEKEAACNRNKGHHSETDRNIGDDTSSKSLSGSSYIESVCDKDEELNLFSDDDDNNEDDDQTGDAHNNENIVENDNDDAKEESLRLYISGESEVEGSDEEEEKDPPDSVPLGAKQGNSFMRNSKNQRTMPFESYKYGIVQKVSCTDKDEEIDSLNDDRLIPGVSQDEMDTDDSNDSAVVLNSQENAPTLIPFNSSYMGLESKRRSAKAESMCDKELSHPGVRPLKDHQLMNEIGDGEQQSTSEISPGSAIYILGEGENAGLPVSSYTDSGSKVVRDCGDREVGVANFGETVQDSVLSKRNNTVEDVVHDSVLGDSSSSSWLTKEYDYKCPQANSSSPLLSKECDFSKVHCTSSGQIDSCRQNLLSNLDSSQKESRNKHSREINMETSDEGSDCVILSSSDNNSARSQRDLTETSDSFHVTGNGDELESYVCDDSSPSPLHTANVSFRQSYLSTTKKRKKDFEEEDGSVEFLYEDCPSTSSPEGQGWLSKETLRPGSDKRTGQKSSWKKMKKFSQSSTWNSDPATIDLTLDDSL